MPDDVKLTVGEHSRNLLQACIEGIPYAGGPLSQVLFGPLTEMRFKRIEKTLSEVALALEENGKDSASAMSGEEFVTLLESALPELGRSTNEHQRKRYRDLLLKASQIEPNSELWQDANLCATLLSEIHPPGLVILGALARSAVSQNTLVSRPEVRLYEGQVDPAQLNGKFVQIPYEWTVIQEWMYRLKEKRLLGIGSADARGGFGGVTLSELGRFFVNWVDHTEG
jgi:hypothetical protein